MKAFGADLTIVPSEDGKMTPDLIPRMMEVAEVMDKEPHTYRTNQFYNKNQLKGYNTIGTEKPESSLYGNLDAFVAAFGTAGCAMGVAEVLKSKERKSVFSL